MALHRSIHFREFYKNMTDVHAYINSVNLSISRKDGRTLASQLALPVGRVKIGKKLKQLAERASLIQPITYCSSNVEDNSLGPVIGHRLAALVAIDQKNWRSAYEHVLSAYNSILEVFKEEYSNWIIPALTKLMNDLRDLASQVLS